ncbi:TlpA family protein disulfide reductase [Pyxidicoccus xibeiensis]|uniref:TlpA family protein disulfide reductase n=1 Tax=Pyxidicoccus xibeiensis TaxID=2906759 RepID=UPI0020A82081|nr:thioredoxin family protein [Pyxidicoccus xibeiensis]MCP3137217.1 thioredoxin family protein [Pyxidicoccus xibeiensis]
MTLAKSLVLCGAVWLAAGCASSRPAAPSEPAHGQLSSLSVASRPDAEFCEHRVPNETCTRCNPHLVEKFKAARDWCGEHAVPESQCYECHPDLSFEPLPVLAEGADLKKLSEAGEDVPDLGAHAVRGKVTVFDFYADWCPPCRKVDAHMFGLLNGRSDVAYRKLNVVSWDTPVAKRHLGGVPNLPFVVVYGRDGREVARVQGLDLGALDKAIAEGGSR